MTEAIAHRGLTTREIRIFDRSGPNVSLGHRRLSIIDLQPRGHQPMTNEDETLGSSSMARFTTSPSSANTCSRRPRFRSRTDTECLIHGYEEWGIDFVKRLNGIFAFALWDPGTGFSPARDRYGVKPLYYWKTGRDSCCF